MTWKIILLTERDEIRNNTCIPLGISKYSSSLRPKVKELVIQMESGILGNKIIF